jgi:single-stranded-DNA-specific exonuclease
MKEKLGNLIDEARRAALLLSSHRGTARVVSHYDADGIAAAAVMARLLSRMGKPFHISIVKQLTDRMIGSLAEEGHSLCIFTDLGSGKLGRIQESLLGNGAGVIVCDHHQAQGQVLPENRERLIHLNPLAFGLDENVSGSGVAYLLARAVSPSNKDLSELAIVGAIGDSQIGSIEENWGLAGLNREILKDAESSGKVRVETGLRLWGKYTRPVHKALEYSVDPFIPGISGSESASVQFLQEMGIALKKESGEWRTLSDLSQEEQKRLAGGIIKERIRSNQENPEWIFGDVYDLASKKRDFRNASEFATTLNACGKMEKAWLGVAMCLDDEDSFEEVREVLAEYRREIGKALDIVRADKEMKEEGENCVFIRAGKKVSEHIISNVVSIMSRSGLLPREKPVFALADTEDGQVKVSARADDSLVEGGLDLQEIISSIVEQTGGEGGGHRGAAGATIPKENEASFTEAVRRMLSRQPARTGGNPSGKESEGKAGKEIHINTSQQEELNSRRPPNGGKLEEESDGHTESEGNRAQGEEEGREEAVQEGRDRGRKGKDRGQESGQEMEREGLVRYFGS